MNSQRLLVEKSPSKESVITGLSREAVRKMFQNVRFTGKTKVLQQLINDYLDRRIQRLMNFYNQWY